MKSNLLILLFIGTIIGSYTKVYPVTIICVVAMIYLAKKQIGTYYRKDLFGINNLNSTYDLDNFPNEYAVLNLATTGSDCTTARIIEIGIIRYSGGVVVDKFSQLINPECSIPAASTKINGIITKMVKKKPTVKVVIPEVYRRLNGQIIVGYNVSFDTGFLNIAFGRADLHIDEMVQIDVKELAKQTISSDDIPDTRFETVKDHFGISVDAADHTTIVNCDVINEIFLHCMSIRNNTDLKSPESVE